MIITSSRHEIVDRPHDQQPASTGRNLAPSTPLTERSLAPDLARGMMLLLIALAHVPWFLYTAPTGAIALHPTDGNLADKVTQAVTMIMVDARVHTMFGFLFGYGIGQLYARQTARGTGPVAVRRLLRRRHLWMIVFGAVHAALLWQGDIIGAYGLIGVIMVPLFFGRSDHTLKVWIGVLLALAVASALLNAGLSMMPSALSEMIPSDQQRLSLAEPSYATSVVERLIAWLFTLFGSLISLALPAAFLIGVLAARHRILDEPGRHLSLLRRLAIWGIAVGWASGAALALRHFDLITVGTDTAWSNLHFVGGILTGVGYAALFALIAHRLSRSRTPAPVHWVAALGRRSMSGYLIQSLAWGPVLAAWGLGLGAHLSSWSVAIYAIAVWAVTVGLATLMECRGFRGPAEIALRRLAYRAGRRNP